MFRCSPLQTSINCCLSSSTLLMRLSHTRCCFGFTPQILSSPGFRPRLFNGHGAMKSGISRCIAPAWTQLAHTQSYCIGRWTCGPRQTWSHEAPVRKQDLTVTLPIHPYVGIHDVQWHPFSTGQLAPLSTCWKSNGYTADGLDRCSCIWPSDKSQLNCGKK